MSSEHPDLSASPAAEPPAQTAAADAAASQDHIDPDNADETSFEDAPSAPQDSTPAAPQTPLEALTLDSESRYDDGDDDGDNGEALPPRAPVNDYLRTSEPIFHKAKPYKDSPNYLLEAKFNKIKQQFDSKDAKNKQQINIGLDNIKSLFTQIKSTTSLMNTERDTVDWNIWEKVLNDYEGLLQEDPVALNEAIMNGIPEEIRGIIWQVVSKSKNLNLEEYYLNLKNEPSIHEKQIKRDITRTSFFNSIQKINKSSDLYNIIKNYSLFDPEVGYTQGMIFIATPLSIALNEAEAFSLLVTLMKEYSLRDMFLPDMKGLHLMLYKFDRLLEVYLPTLFNHLARQGIKSSMYASQWFLTLFTYKFPIEIVLRIYDILTTQGIEALLKFSINLMIRNEHNLLNLRFDGLLNFLKNNLFNVYVNPKYIAKNGSSKKLADAKDFYDLNRLVYDSMEINFNPNDLERYDLEFETIYETDLKKKDTIDEINIQNGKLRSEIKSLQMSLLSLNKDHMSLVQNLVNLKVKLPELLNEQAELREQIDYLNEDISQLKSKVNDSADIPTDIENEITKLLEINKNETEKNMLLEDELNELLEQERAVDEKLSSIKKNWFWKK